MPCKQRVCTRITRWTCANRTQTSQELSRIMCIAWLYMHCMETKVWIAGCGGNFRCLRQWKGKLPPASNCFATLHCAAGLVIHNWNVHAGDFVYRLCTGWCSVTCDMRTAISRGRQALTTICALSCFGAQTRQTILPIYSIGPTLQLLLYCYVVLLCCAFSLACTACTANPGSDANSRPVLQRWKSRIVHFALCRW